jgi:hypothetical protein
VQIEQSTLEDVYFGLVGRGITHYRDDADAEPSPADPPSRRRWRRR